MLGEALALYQTLKNWTRGKQIILFPSGDLRDTTSCRARLFLTVDATIGNQALSRQCCNILSYRVFSHDVTAAILVSQNNPVGVKLFSYANAFFCSHKFAWILAT